MESLSSYYSPNQSPSSQPQTHLHMSYSGSQAPSGSPTHSFGASIGDITPPMHPTSYTSTSSTSSLANSSEDFYLDSFHLSQQFASNPFPQPPTSTPYQCATTYHSDAIAYFSPTALSTPTSSTISLSDFNPSSASNSPNSAHNSAFTPMVTCNTSLLHTNASFDPFTLATPSHVLLVDQANTNTNDTAHSMQLQGDFASPMIEVLPSNNVESQPFQFQNPISTPFPHQIAYSMTDSSMGSTAIQPLFSTTDSDARFAQQRQTLKVSTHHPSPPLNTTPATFSPALQLSHTPSTTPAPQTGPFSSSSSRLIASYHPPVSSNSATYHSSTSFGTTSGSFPPTTFNAHGQQSFQQLQPFSPSIHAQRHTLQPPTPVSANAENQDRSPTNVEAQPQESQQQRPTSEPIRRGRKPKAQLEEQRAKQQAQRDLENAFDIKVEKISETFEANLLQILGPSRSLHLSRASNKLIRTEVAHELRSNPDFVCDLIKDEAFIQRVSELIFNPQKSPSLNTAISAMSSYASSSDASLALASNPTSTRRRSVPKGKSGAKVPSDDLSADDIYPKTATKRTHSQMGPKVATTDDCSAADLVEYKHSRPRRCAPTADESIPVAPVSKPTPSSAKKTAKAPSAPTDQHFVSLQQNSPPLPSPLPSTNPAAPPSLPSEAMILEQLQQLQQQQLQLQQYIQNQQRCAELEAKLKKMELECTLQQQFIVHLHKAKTTTPSLSRANSSASSSFSSPFPLHPSSATSPTFLHNEDNIIDSNDSAALLDEFNSFVEQNSSQLLNQLHVDQTSLQSCAQAVISSLNTNQ